MTKIKHRSFIVIILSLLVMAGLSLFVIEYINDGAKWAAFSANDTVYDQGNLKTGQIIDRDGVSLLRLTENGYIYSDDCETRVSTLHAVGDPYGNISSGAVSVFDELLIGYNIVTGLNNAERGGTVELALSSKVNNVALSALDGRKGTVAVANCETGEIICMVSSPSYDPNNPPESFNDDEYDGVFLNRFLSSSYTPGSIFKLVTTAAAIETLPDFFERTYYCDGEMEFGEDFVTCTGVHGTIDAREALAYSCNCSFAQIALEVGDSTIARYADAYGLTSGFYINGIATADGQFECSDDEVNIAWSGIGQYHDLVCPASVLRFMTAICDGGKAPELTLLKTSKQESDSLIMNSDTASILSEMMRNNARLSYDESRFKDITLYAKSGTAEVGTNESPHAWFVGYGKKDDISLAFVVLIENGGSGSTVAGSVAAEVLSSAFTLYE